MENSIEELEDKFEEILQSGTKERGREGEGENRNEKKIRRAAREV